MKSFVLSYQAPFPFSPCFPSRKLHSSKKCTKPCEKPVELLAHVITVKDSRMRERQAREREREKKRKNERERERERERKRKGEIAKESRNKGNVRNIFS